MFPFHLSSTIFADPECWNVICDDNSVYQFTRKVKALPGGALFKYDNGCSVFLSYNFFSILKESNITQSRLSLDMFRAVTEKFFIEYHQDLSAIPPLANTLVQFCCHSLSNQNPEHYVCCQKAKVSSNKLVVLSFAKWIIYLQNSSDLCFHTDSDTKLIVEDDYRIHGCQQSVFVVLQTCTVPDSDI